MSVTTSPPLNPSQAVERIREIIVGRQFDRLEQRVTRLESAGPAAPSSPVEDGRLAGEARLAELKQDLHRIIDAERSHTDGQIAGCRGEIQRLSARIQQIAAANATAAAGPGVRELEQKLGGWLAGWQRSLHQHLGERDDRLADQIRGEVATLWAETERQITRVECRMSDREAVEERFRRIAIAARALADCASPAVVAEENRASR